MKEIYFNDDGSRFKLLNDQTIKLDTELVVDEINLSSDVVICTPSFKDEKHDIKFNGHGFSLYNAAALRFNNKNDIVYFSRTKMTVPNGLDLQFSSQIPGLFQFALEKEIYEGIEFTEEIKTEFTDTIVWYSNDINYQFYNKLIFTLKEYDRELFTTYSNKNFKSNIKIPENSLILNLNFINTFIGLEKSTRLNEIYIIHSDYIYHNFPNMGGFNACS